MILMHDKLKFENHYPCLYLQVNLEAHYYHYKSGVLVIVFRGLLVYTYIDTEISFWLGESVLKLSNSNCW